MHLGHLVYVALTILYDWYLALVYVWLRGRLGEYELRSTSHLFDVGCMGCGQWETRYGELVALLSCHSILASSYIMMCVDMLSYIVLCHMNPSDVSLRIP